VSEARAWVSEASERVGDVSEQVSEAGARVGDASGQVERLQRDDAAWDAFVEANAEGSHLQLTAWQGAKAGTGWRAIRVVADGGSGPIGAQVLVRRLGPGPFAVGYAGRGPIATRFDSSSLHAFTQALRRAARQARLTHVTVDPGQPPGAATIMAAAGWRPGDLVQHAGTRVIDLDRTEEEVWSGLRSTSRRYVSRARRDGCTVREGSETDLAAFHAILVETAERSGFVHRSLAAYRDAYRAFAPSGRALLLFCDLPDGTPAATKLLLRCGGTMTQPYSGMTGAGADARANYLLEWETIVRLRELGLARYDMWGRSTPGIAWFKAGFGGYEADYCGAWDLVVQPLVHGAVRSGHRAWVRFARWRRGLDPHTPGAAADAAGTPTQGQRSDREPAGSRPEGEA
jgi:lipid II:glycine glycyltransferase (peptidoglycan interpeptide bridge formation enzyme)